MSDLIAVPRDLLQDTLNLLVQHEWQDRVVQVGTGWPMTIPSCTHCRGVYPVTWMDCSTVKHLNQGHYQWCDWQKIAGAIGMELSGPSE